MIEPAKELAKLAKRKEQLQSSISKLEKDSAKPDYEAKVPEDVRAANKEKLESCIGELERLSIAEKTLGSMQ